MNGLYIKMNHALNKIALLHRLMVQQFAARSGIFMGQLPVLKFVTHHPGCTQRQVAEFLELSPPSITATVKRMVRDGLLEKTIDPEDLRQNRLTVTEAGQAVSRRCCNGFDEIDAKMFAGFSEEELEQLSGYLERILGNISCDQLTEDSPFSLMKLANQLERAEKKHNKEE